ncbi:alpha/beta fold hydrolase [Pseudoduganella namucuonensis]|nr:alpha/beta fold hydrolase [Pseudoduganella namucuonensis]
MAEATDRSTLRAAVQLPGARLYFEESGAGEPIVFLLGHSLDRRQWRPQVKDFERRHRVIRYDLRGYGRSSLPREGEHFLHAGDLRQFMDALGIRRAHLVGLSLGGAVVKRYRSDTMLSDR